MVLLAACLVVIVVCVPLVVWGWGRPERMRLLRLGLLLVGVALLIAGAEIYREIRHKESVAHRRPTQGEGTVSEEQSGVVVEGSEVEGRLVTKISAREFCGGEDPRWRDFRGVFQFEVTNPMASPATMGTTINVVVPKAGVERDGFTQMSGDVERFQVGAVYRLTLTENLPPGWESIREEQKEGFLGLFCCVRAELLERRNY